MAERHTSLVTSRLARSRALLEAARIGAHGRQIMSPGQAAARLAGGFLQTIEREALQEQLHQVLKDSSVDLGELNTIRDLPGMVRAATRTLQNVWSGGVDLEHLASQEGQQRLIDLSALEAAVLRRLPASMLRPSDLVTLASQRLEQAPAVLGPVSLEGVPDLDPVWRPFLKRLAESVSVTWHLATVDPPEWLKGSKIHLTQASHETPELARFSCANPRHEALEALRWARSLIATRIARPDQIALASPALGDWDEHIATISADANLPVSFAGGRPALTIRDGQAAADD